MLLGIDDTDSPNGMCTTYLGALIARKLRSSGYFVNNMRLVRLNPNVIWKTRGNAGICIETNAPKEYLFSLACEYVDKYAMFDCENTNPGVVVVETKPPADFYQKALREFCTIEEAEERLNEIGALYKGYKNKRGLIGSLAAVSSVLPDKTYECLSYRYFDKCGTPREFEEDGFFECEKATAPNTWDTVDFKLHKVICIPHGKDPVLYGIRGESPEFVREAAGYLKTEEPEFIQVWETNQGTDAHIIHSRELFEGGSFCFEGVVDSAPETQRGGHVSFGVDGVKCFAFEPTKYFRDAVRELVVGDKVIIYGSYQNGVMNVEKFYLAETASVEKRESPKCPVCGGRMTSAGKGKGYKCRDCSARIREVDEVKRNISVGWYEVPPGSRRHLAKPVCRFG
ncbi:MAG: tRNA(Ile)(2)-agmatinylcytidine synthase [Methanocorpusculum sp.]|nr:tRNA(Ile)(2)-agmatinylcytidine synthase [Methanocorpusculum sp.]